MRTKLFAIIFMVSALTIKLNAESVCQFAVVSTRYEYPNICAELDSSATLSRKWNNAYNSKHDMKNIGLGLIIVGGILDFIGVFNLSSNIDDEAKSITENEECNCDRPYLPFLIPGNASILGGVIVLALSGTSVSGAINETEMYYKSKNASK